MPIIVHLVRLKLTIASDKGSEQTVSTSIEVKPIHFKVEAWVKEPSAREQKRIKSDCSLIEIMLVEIEEGFMKESWQLVGWECSDGIKRALVNEQLQELASFPLKVKQPNKLFLKIPDLDIGQSPFLTLSVEGPGKIIKKVVVQLSLAQRMAIVGKIKRLSKEIVEAIKKVDTYLHKPEEELLHDELRGMIKETKRKIAGFKDTIDMLQESPTFKAGSLPEKSKDRLQRVIEEELPVLEKKKLALEAKLKEKEEAFFDASLQVTGSKAIFIHEQTALSLTLSSNIPEAYRASYTIQSIEVSEGKLLFERSQEAVKVGSKLDFGSQPLVFQPHEQISKRTLVDIKLTITNNKGSTAKVVASVEIRPIRFGVEAWINKSGEAERKLLKTVQADKLWIVEIMLREVAEGLSDVAWKLASWAWSEGVVGTLMNEQLEKLSCFPLKGKQKSKLYLELYKLSTDKENLLTLVVEGPGGATQKATVTLLLAQQLSLSNKLTSLLNTIMERQDKVAAYLASPPKAREYDALEELIQETGPALTSFQEELSLLEDDYIIKQGLLSEENKALLTKITGQAIPGLLEKKGKLEAEAALENNSFFLSL
jgi:hypothetical protein